ncbi:MAG: sarcosine oxidase subunit delta [Actinomycetota bacterium]|nr:sarcosine oxidase subunit delta [Actinomycetota bacterium]
MSLLVACPTCGERPYTEFSFGGELRDVSSPDVTSDFARVYLRENTAGVQAERWFHELGCRLWVTLRRDTSENRFEA